MVIFRNLNIAKLKILQYSIFPQQKPPWSVVFFGSDDFSLHSLKLLHTEYLKGALLNNLEIVTTLKKHANPVQNFAKKNQLIVHDWPYQVAEKKYDVGIVVSFGHLLSENLINAFPYGILNIHASLLPRWRGAAPIIHALANGDTETGITVMRIKPKHFDTGDIVMQKKVEIEQNMKMPELHKILGELGGFCVLSTLKQLPEALKGAKPQPNIGVTFAPKINSDFALINWQTMSSFQIQNLDRAISGILTPTCSWRNTPVKLMDIEECINCNNLVNESPGYVQYHKQTKTLRILCANKTSISVGKVGVVGKKVMSATDFHNGFISKEPISSRYFT